jgi:activating signal cointegrator complex subunit 1
MRRTPFSYSDILTSPACQLLGANPATHLVPKSEEREILGNARADSDVPESTLTKVPVAGSTREKSKYRAPLKVPPPLSITLGTYLVREVQLWEMGSHGSNNQYVSCGGIVLE